MADGDVLVDTEATFQGGTRVRLFAVESTDYPGGVNYRFQYYDPDSGREFLRYDNSQVPTHGAGHHHRHEWIDGDEKVTGIEFEDLETHLADFRDEVTNYER
ncbi:hypothetical protein EL22_20445 [Halostagnicola sp. A56]|uniref:toxin-antitoxin system TumE family protein n=1 Tax=Halostagnicola sp. A56 TaxID=1495067 RepID=UPI00049F1066|nr:DUF6516 family protein [Halostagnicola sp. A56]KDE59557.1 hypothetical protein EL22_20445 [Halostagnicola sp. A56]